MDYSNPGLLGAFIGLVLGFIDYVIVMALIGRALSREAANPDEEPPSAEGRAKVERSMRFIKPALMFGSFVLFPVTGYFAGRQFAS